MPSKPFVIHLIGPSTSGKSSVFKSLGERLSLEIYWVSYDKLKWQLVNYHRDKHMHIIKELTVGLFELTCSKHIPIFLDCYIKDDSEYAHLKEIAAKDGYAFLSIELTAPIEVLLARFRERVQSAKLTGSNLSVSSEDIFLSETSRRPYVPENTPIFDTSKESLESITEEIVKLVNDL